MPNDNVKAPSQIFRWFEKMKSNYENSIVSVLERFEKNTDKQNLRIDTQNKTHINSLKDIYAQQLTDKNNTIDYLKSEIEFYKQQFSQQQKVLENLNNRYDTVMHSLISDNKRKDDIKDIFDNEQFDLNTEVLTTNTTPEIENSYLNDLYNEALVLRKDNENDKAFLLFKEAAENGEVKSMGALARAYFLNEGVEENQLIGLAWLINAAELDHIPAKKRCDEFKEMSPEFYQEALVLAKELNLQHA